MGRVSGGVSRETEEKRREEESWRERRKE